MALDAATLRTFVAASSSEAPDAALDDLLATAEVLVESYTEDLDAEIEIPAPILERAQLLVAAELWNQDQAPNGFLNQQFESPDGMTSAPVRIGTDPLRPAYALLARWVDPVTFA